MTDISLSEIFASILGLDVREYERRRAEWNKRRVRERLTVVRGDACQAHDVALQSTQPTEQG